ncbi:MAG: flavin reductase family protein [candidate division WOR-3 bacterium]
MKKLEKYPYRLLHPKLVTIVTSIDENNTPNACTTAWSMPVSINPPLVAIALNKRHKTSANIEKTGEFIINIPDFSQLGLVEKCGDISGWKINKFKEFQIQSTNAEKVRPPRIAGCPGYIECKLYAKYEGGDHFIFVGEIVHAEVDENLFNEMWNKDTKLVFHFGGDIYGKIERA